jgi:BirA family transcriptional regulator, biotin operon repressor / biotin---[acetyl-CoA-carboxylase] ligase
VDLSSPWPVVRFEEIDSTNEEARRRATQGDFGPYWITARTQTAGRGRLGREWSSPDGNLFATALFDFPRPVSEAALVCFSAGLAVIDAARGLGADVSMLRLKWPNDVLVREAKLAGILIETGQHRNRLWMAAGFGINVATAPERADRATACLAWLPGGAGRTAEETLASLDVAFRNRLSSLLSEGFVTTRTAWLEKAAHMGKRVELTPATGRIEGVMTGLDTDGALTIRLDNGSVTHVRAGEISLLG